MPLQQMVFKSRNHDFRNHYNQREKLQVSRNYHFNGKGGEGISTLLITCDRINVTLKIALKSTKRF